MSEVAPWTRGRVSRMKQKRAMNVEAKSKILAGDIRGGIQFFCNLCGKRSNGGSGDTNTPRMQAIISGKLMMCAGCFRENP